MYLNFGSHLTSDPRSILWPRSWSVQIDVKLDGVWIKKRGPFSSLIPGVHGSIFWIEILGVVGSPHSMLPKVPSRIDRLDAENMGSRDRLFWVRTHVIWDRPKPIQKMGVRDRCFWAAKFWISNGISAWQLGDRFRRPILRPVRIALWRTLVNFYP